MGSFGFGLVPVLVPGEALRLLLWRHFGTVFVFMLVVNWAES